MSESRQPMSIVCFGQQNWDVCWSAKQHLLVRLARRGHGVLYIDPIPDLSHRSVIARIKALSPSITGLGLRPVEDGVHVFTPPWAHLLPDLLNRRRRRAMVGAIARRLGLDRPVALCMWPAQRWLMDGIRPAARVYLAVDDNASFGGLDEAFAKMQRREEERLLGECHVALAVSPTLLERFRQLQPRVYLQENGVALEDFTPRKLADSQAHSAIVGLPRPRVGFVGQIDDRMDQELVIALARSLAARENATQIVLAGRVKEGVDVSRLVAEPNVHLIGFVPYRELTSVYGALDVGVVPYLSSPLTQACNPLKVYEYLAADLPTVATDLSGLNTTRGAVAVARTPREFLKAVDKALHDRAYGRDMRQRVAASASWDRRAELLEKRLYEALEVAAAGHVLAGAPPTRAAGIQM